jgi:hypothetical protein
MVVTNAIQFSPIILGSFRYKNLILSASLIFSYFLSNPFSLSKWLNHWPGFRLLFEDEKDELFDLIWTRVIPKVAENFGVITHDELFDILKGFLDEEVLEPMDNRNKVVFNQGFAMSMQKESFLVHAQEKIRVNNLIIAAASRKKVIDDAIKKASKANKKEQETTLCENIDRNKEADIVSINSKRDTDILVVKNDLKTRLANINQRKHKRNTGKELQSIIDDKEHANQQANNQITLIKDLAKIKISDIKSKLANERKQLIKSNAANLRANGHTDPLPGNRDDDEEEEEEEDEEDL